MPSKTQQRLLLVMFLWLPGCLCPGQAHLVRSSVFNTCWGQVDLASEQAPGSDLQGALMPLPYWLRAPVTHTAQCVWRRPHMEEARYSVVTRVDRARQGAVPGPLACPWLLCHDGNSESGPRHSEPQFPPLAHGPVFHYSKHMLRALLCASLSWCPGK